MKIDYMLNPLAIVEKVIIPYGDGLHVEGRIRAHVEEGFDEVTWFSGELWYPKHHCEVGAQIDEKYQDLKRGSSEQVEVERKMRLWCESMKLEISDVVVETVGVRV